MANGYALDEGETPLGAFLTKVSLATDTDETQKTDNFITLMTLHAAKGLEYPVVFIVGMEENLFPHSRSLQDDNEMEEERRLCYVGMTRAQEKLYLLNTRRRMQWGNIISNEPSRFIGEIPEILLEKTGTAAQGFYNDNAYTSYSNSKPQYNTNKNHTTRQNINVFTGIPKKVTKNKKADTDTSLIKIGEKVIHAKYGLGVIVSTSGEGETFEVGVAFPDLGIKQLIWRYAPIKKAEV